MKLFFYYFWFVSSIKLLNVLSGVILKFNLIIFFYSYETSDGIARYEQGALKNVGTENEALELRGSYSYVGNDGKQYTVNYVADENGFRPEGAHLPVV